ncbi:MAG TPA: hypothetical protein VGM76_19065 [Lacipirellulaceae bacterium]
MAAVSWLKYAYLAYASKPRTDRQLYRLVKLHRICRIVELGIGSIERSTTLIGVGQRCSAEGKVAYTGLDWFDARSGELPSLTLKEAHCQLQATGAQIRLTPGEPARSLRGIANAHPHTGLLLISAAVNDSTLDSAWFYVPRMLDGRSIVLRERLDSAGQSVFEMISMQKLAEFVERVSHRQAA